MKTFNQVLVLFITLIFSVQLFAQAPAKKDKKHREKSQYAQNNMPHFSPYRNHLAFPRHLDEQDIENNVPPSLAKHWQLTTIVDDTGRDSKPVKSNSPLSNYATNRSIGKVMGMPEIDWVAEYAAGVSASFDNGSAISTDAAGNVFVSGNSAEDFLTVKYNAAGGEEWSARYDGSGNADDFVRANTVDLAGNVYVTGMSTNAAGDYDYTTVKYNSAGEQEWVARYDGGQNDIDNPLDIVVDSVGNVYVSGASVGSNGDYGMTTVKYNDTGEEQWTVQLGGTGNIGAATFAMAIDDASNIYTTGWRYLNGAVDMVAVKYNADGVQQWLAAYNGPGNNADYGNDISVDASGNVYITGYSYGAGSNFDVATIKFSPSGGQQWVSRYNGSSNDRDYGNALAVDALGNVYVAAESYDANTNFNYVTLQYNADGVEQWMKEYDGPGSDFDAARHLAIDASGNVIVGGTSDDSEGASDYTAIAYNDRGDELWVARFNGSGDQGDYTAGITFDHNGNVCISGTSFSRENSGDIATVKYNSAGNEEWVAYYNGPWRSRDTPTAMTLDQSGNIYVTGAVEAGTFENYATAKYDANGSLQWVSQFDGSAQLIDRPVAIVVDDPGNVYVTGTSWSDNTANDFATVKYDANGTEQWVVRHSSIGSNDDFAGGMVIDNDGNIYITGASGTDGNLDYTTIKYSPAGTQQWIASYNGPANDYDFPEEIALDESGNIYVTGSSWGTNSFNDYATVKYNADGVEQWVSRYNGPDNDWDSPKTMTVDADGSVYVTGGSWGTNSLEDYATVKYNADGIEQWVSRYNGPDNDFDTPVGIAVDGVGNIYVSGYSWQSNSSADFATIKYNADGSEQWVSRYNGPGNGYDAPAALVVAGPNKIYVTGASYDANTNSDITTLSYDSSGSMQWALRHDGPVNGDDAATAISLDATGNIYITGSSEFASGTQFTTIKYLAITTGLTDQPAAASQFALQQNYPNPFNPTTNIRFSLDKSSHAILIIYDVAGRAVSRLVDQYLPAGSYERTFQAGQLPSGVYFYRLQANGQMQTRKLILLK